MSVFFSVHFIQWSLLHLEWDGTDLQTPTSEMTAYKYAYSTNYDYTKGPWTLSFRCHNVIMGNSDDSKNIDNIPYIGWEESGRLDQEKYISYAVGCDLYHGKIRILESSDGSSYSSVTDVDGKRFFSRSLLK